jgi:hypothetical protein
MWHSEPLCNILQTNKELVAVVLKSEQQWHIFCNCTHVRNSVFTIGQKNGAWYMYTASRYNKQFDVRKFAIDVRCHITSGDMYRLTLV